MQTIKQQLKNVIIYDNKGQTLDRYTVYIPDGSVFGMSENAEGFNQYLGEWYEVLEGSHLGTKLKRIPPGIKQAILNRLTN